MIEGLNVYKAEHDKFHTFYHLFTHSKFNHSIIRKLILSFSSSIIQN